jgi:hypothetical protein
MTEHADHGREARPGDGPEEPDCACRGTHAQRACAMEGCGFCQAAERQAREEFEPDPLP